MPHRKPFIAGNWKMNLNKGEAVALAHAVAAKVPPNGPVKVGVIPPFVYLDAVGQATENSDILLGAQDVYFEKSGAFTGEISIDMLKDLGVEFVLIGHSERRHILEESDPLLNKKLHAVLAQKQLTAILCVGETVEERKAENTFAIIARQLDGGLQGVNESQAPQLVIAYEPVWAIGTGLNATPQQAQEVHVFVRQHVAKLLGRPAAEKLVIQYGGSVKASNAAELLAQPDIDGALVGGASLKAEEFLGIIHAAGALKEHQ